ncbi:MAG: Wzz/FepE/Etk N-terminal domain-containing protein [Actinobacteria bacterium]|nr:Wzz/FepE/Etk N-terminal domain-containing protein [Actinomycetota bacterium]
MELRHYASILWRWLWLIALGTILAAGTSYLVSRSMPKVYASTTTLLVNQAQTPGTIAYNDVLTSQQLTKTYSQLIIQTPVLQSAIDSLHLAITPEQLSGQAAERPGGAGHHAAQADRPEHRPEASSGHRHRRGEGVHR